MIAIFARLGTVLLLVGLLASIGLAFLLWNDVSRGVGLLVDR